jgi:nucleotide-binding universal stress UspA family protein
MTQRATESGGAMRRLRLLAATDLSSRSDRALRRAGLLAAACGADLVLMHAVDDDQPRSLIEAESREALRLLRDQMTALPELHALNARPAIEEGDPFDAILRAAEAHAADLILLGEHRRRLLRDIFVGTTLERVMRHAARPVLMVNAAPAGAYRQVLAATDLSPHALHALQAAERLGLLDGAALTVMHAFEPPALGPLALADVPAAAVASHESAAAREAAAALDGFVTEALPGRDTARRVVRGQPAGAIRDMVARLHPDLLVLGTAGAGMLRRAVLGSVAAEVIGRVGCDALVVPPTDVG